MVKIEIVGYKKIAKENKNLYHLSAISKDTPYGCNGFATYNGFITESYMKECGISEEDLIGSSARYFTVKENDRYRSVISLKA